jgi:CheY-like chemotaxis protein
VTASSTPLRVLLVEDREDDAAFVILALEQGGYEVTWQRVETPEATAEALRGQTWDVIISDFHMPRFSAPAALALRRELGVDTPFIIVSGTVGEEEAVETMKAGAIDFVTKGKFARLAPAVVCGLREVEERQARRNAEAQLQQAQKMEAVGLLAGGVAHDFNNILGIITGYCGLLLRDLDAHDSQRPRVEQVLNAAERGATLTRQLRAAVDLVLTDVVMPMRTLNASRKSLAETRSVIGVVRPTRTSHEKKLSPRHRLRGS